MTTAQQWLDLAERIEAATGANYQLDCDIWDALYPGERDARFVKVNASYGGRLGPADRDGYVQPLRAVTASLDAALTLVPEGWDGVLYLATEYTRPCAQLETPAMRARFSMDYESATGEAVTLPLALCAAACRARAGMEG
ncbi:hypothetical protein GCM10023232_24490 [Sphingosinicella ginsenosidimutans]|uniref:Uncharacterized protein n=1 Tax=Allosphingosinicella ginsenosidimutans TaxID=1176539 RepID=A0A5C6TUL3_9SPHN|nr:hypothetical protein [Sphingosinicella ginsenosidimutans]TXC63909.1 hypothetical protein FRZ32_09720 [Sphingosinicella ginsenosidimutans]